MVRFFCVLILILMNEFLILLSGENGKCEREFLFSFLALRIQMSEKTRKTLADANNDDFIIEPRGYTDVKVRK